MYLAIANALFKELPAHLLHKDFTWAQTKISTRSVLMRLRAQSQLTTKKLRKKLQKSLQMSQKSLPVLQSFWRFFQIRTTTIASNNTITNPQTIRASTVASRGFFCTVTLKEIVKNVFGKGFASMCNRYRPASCKVICKHETTFVDERTLWVLF